MTGRAWTVTAAGALAALAFGLGWYGSHPSLPARVVMPALSGDAQAGQDAFARHCAACHGVDASGSAKGPALVHRLYHPAHHADVAFERAVQQGVRAHHWRLGDMPPEPALTRAEIGPITEYIRSLQRANGIY